MADLVGVDFRWPNGLARHSRGEVTGDQAEELLHQVRRYEAINKIRESMAIEKAEEERDRRILRELQEDRDYRQFVEEQREGSASA
jgi:hypothetical protein